MQKELMMEKAKKGGGLLASRPDSQSIRMSLKCRTIRLIGQTLIELADRYEAAVALIDALQEALKQGVVTPEMGKTIEEWREFDQRGRSEKELDYMFMDAILDSGIIKGWAKGGEDNVPDKEDK